eukprot:350941-Chlamydomonas_euryale.AAC.5
MRASARMWVGERAHVRVHACMCACVCAWECVDEGCTAAKKRLVRERFHASVGRAVDQWGSEMCASRWTDDQVDIDELLGSEMG